LVGEAVNHYNEPLFQEISDLKSRYDFDGFYGMLAGIHDIQDPYARQAKINEAREKTGVTEEAQIAFEKLSDEVINPVENYNLFSKRFKELGDQESIESSQAKNKSDFKAALDASG